MITCSRPLAWMNIAKTANSLHIYHSDHIESTSLADALQMVMQELVKTKPSLKPETPLHMESEDGVPTWLTAAWSFNGFHIIAVTKARHSPSGDTETRYEFIPFEH